ncbi:MAG TPA: histidinol-phosphate transaminase, partial [Candidatus Krumholzibacteria bacterium]|nr:histidinol-phosphate transaminase [Candidatus Krumholzibacteria bacterium]
MNIDKIVRPGVRQIQRYQPGEDHPGCIKLSSNENPRPPHPRIVEAVVAAMLTSNRYPESGCPELTRALAKHHGIPDDEVMVGHGSNEIIDLLVRACAGAEENVVFPAPSFIVYHLIAKVCGCEGIAVPCRDYRMDLPAMAKAVTDRTRAVFLCNPNNPTSTYVTETEVRAFIRDLPPDLFIVMDEAYIDYVTATDYPDSMRLRGEYPNLVILRTFSKFFAIAGVRVGYAMAHRDVVDVLHRVRQPFNVSRLAEAAGLAALKCRDELTPLTRETASERERVRAEVLKLGFTSPPSQTNFLFVDLGSS